MVSFCRNIPSLIVFRSKPHHQSADFVLFDKTLGSGPIPFRDRDWKKHSPLAMDLIRACLEVDPQQRISVDDALQHPWFQTE